jgi:hypothetical protein
MSEPTRPQPENLPPEFQGDLAADYYRDDNDAYASGPGCLVWTLLMVAGMIVSILIVLLAGAAGWSEGQRIANDNLQATSAALAQRQLPAIQTNIAEVNPVQMGTRVAFLATRTPGVPQVAELQATGTALSANATTVRLQVQAELDTIPQILAAGEPAQLQTVLDTLRMQTPGVPEVLLLNVTATAFAQNALVSGATATPEPAEPDSTTPEPAAPITEQQPTAEATPQPTTGGNQAPQLPQPADLLVQAEEEIAFGQLEEATETLDLIRRIDPDFNPGIVEQLLFDVLTQRARTAFQVSLSGDPTNTGTLAEAVRLTDQAEQFGTPAQLDNLLYERDLASLYLNAVSAIEANNHSIAIQRLDSIRQFQTQYKGVDVNRLLFDEYVAYGDAFFQFDRDYCRAENQYAAALTLFNDAGVSGKRSNAESLCQSAPAQPPPVNLPPGETPVAPIGVPGT